MSVVSLFEKRLKFASKKKQKEFMDHLFQDLCPYIETTLYVIFALK